MQSCGGEIAQRIGKIGNLDFFLPQHLATGHHPPAIGYRL